MSTTILWRRLDREGHESARLVDTGEGRELSGAAVFEHEGEACRLDYLVRCDGMGVTRSTTVRGWLGGRAISVEIEVDEAGRWRLNGAEQPAVEGCLDVDLNFSPSTNLLPIRRLGLAVGEEALVRAAWLRFPSFALEPLDQVYRRTGERTWRYESAGGAFTADLKVEAAGFVLRYAGIWERVAGA